MCLRVTSAGNLLNLNGGTTGVIAASSFAGNGNLTLTNSASTSFSGAVNAGTVSLNNTAGTIAFNGVLSAVTLNTAAQGYNVALNAGGSITNATTFSNTGGVTLAGTTSFAGALTSTASTTTLNGMVYTSGNAISLGTVALTGTSVLDTTNNGVTTTGANHWYQWWCEWRKCVNSKSGFNWWY